MKRLPDSIAALVLLVGLSLACARCLAACAHAPAALDVAGHSAALAVCRSEGKAARSYAVYETCADEADRRYMPERGAP